ncbi:carboxypeptidase-like regulatory domain-containing protein [Paracrocinitomix mangrovi]|uniref:carboxypeptidase-like regulatory domain-containing protein n=1 Tax=Paracrocinitomix mangrovi TaxID=2862509 RepID=UPI001C8D4AC4|nr:carboxypeptidase-like regulatory domain-containing protein [Paracrocinitomix mangrovi]UKN00526.1 carboxypeptidase-like regulatory domain-containing protein [Paracrocinitomix mangrovi]
MKKLSAFILLFISAQLMWGQDLTQNIRGTVVDSESKFPLVGTKVKVTDVEPVLGGICDENGNFAITNVPIGKHTLEISSIGYMTKSITVIVNSGKESIVNILLEESSIVGEEVVVEGRKKGEVINEMATVSATSFSVEETNRYAGSRGDPARMMSNYAGAQGTDDSRNDLVIRGNSPLGIIYRIEGVSIPNPNHFAIAGSTGGPVSILNNKFLDNSDFFMSAFPAEYGNSTAGIFDLRLRNGNNKLHEFSGQFGFLGTEALFEGPFSKKSNASYLVMGRYSTLGLFDKIGLKYGTDAVPLYGDGAFKLNFPLKKGSNLSVWGVGGTSNISILISDQTEPAQDAFGEQDRDQLFGTAMAIGGVTYKNPINKNTFLKTTISYSWQQQTTRHLYILRTLDSATNQWNYLADPFDMMGYKYVTNTGSAYLSMNHKLGKKHVLKYGFNLDMYLVNNVDSIRYDISDSTSNFYYRWDYQSPNPDFLGQLFVMWKYKINNRLTLNTGLHSQYFTMSNSISPIEPRLGLKIAVNENNTIALGAGMHSQHQPLYIYSFHKNIGGNKVYHNMDLGFTRSIHTVISYSTRIKKSMSFKTEAYYQYLYDVPVTVAPSSFSILNQGSGFARFFPDSLANTGTGYNYGIEFTLQKFFDNDFFFMTTLSLYDSKYVGSDGITRNTDFNGNYIANGLMGKEFKFGENDKHLIALGMKVTYAGGKRYGYVNQVMTDSLKEIVWLDSAYNERRFDPYFRLDLKVNYTLNTKKVTHEFGLDLVNVTFHKNILGLTYTPNDDPAQPPYTERYQLGFLPIFYYKIDFKVAGKPKSLND